MPSVDFSAKPYSKTKPHNDSEKPQGFEFFKEVKINESRISKELVFSCFEAPTNFCLDENSVTNLLEIIKNAQESVLIVPFDLETIIVNHMDNLSFQDNLNFIIKCCFTNKCSPTYMMLSKLAQKAKSEIEKEIVKQLLIKFPMGKRGNSYIMDTLNNNLQKN